MDGTRFDQWTRALVAGRSRRGALRTLVGGVAAGALALRGAGRAEAHHKAKHKKKDGAACPAGPTSCCECAFGGGCTENFDPGTTDCPNICGGAPNTSCVANPGDPFFCRCVDGACRQVPCGGGVG